MIENLLLLIAAIVLLLLFLREENLIFGSIFLWGVIFIALYSNIEETLKLGTFMLLLIMWLMRVVKHKAKSKNEVYTLFIGVVFVLSLLATPVEASEHNQQNNTPPGQILTQLEWVDEVGKVTAQPTLDVLGTHYVIGDEGKIQAWAREGHLPIPNATCYANALYPDANTLFIDNQLMISVNKTWFEGHHYLDFTVPNTTGVYPVSVFCYYQTDEFRDVVDTSTGDLVVATGNAQHTNLRALDNMDETYYVLRGTAGGGSTCDGTDCHREFSISLPTGWETGLEDARILYKGHFEGKQIDYRWEVYNPSEASYVEWFNMTAIGQTYNEQFVVGGDYQGVSELLVRVTAFDADEKDLLFNDALYTTRIYEGQYQEDLRGSEEIVVSKGLSEHIEGEQLIKDDHFVLIFFFTISIILFMFKKGMFAGVTTLFFGLALLQVTGDEFLAFGVFIFGIIIMIMYATKRKTDVDFGG